jgi:predicted NBD/HSP70 family sugar kinase
VSAGQREQGRRLIFDAIRAHGPVPRIELSAHTGISRATVTTITAEMLARGLIEETLPDEEARGAGRGRPRVDLKLRGAAHLVAGVKVSTSDLSLMLMDFEGRDLAVGTHPLERGIMSPDRLVDEVATALSDLMAREGRTHDALSGLGVGIAGIVDALRGFVHWSPSLSETNVDLGAMLRARLGIPAIVDNDANLVAVAEHRFGLARGHSDFVVITIESGVGLGIVLGGDLYRGSRGCGAEFGHIKVQLDGALCRCGQRGCLEAYVADYALLREAALIMAPDRDHPATLARLLEAAHDNDPIAQSILTRAGRMFAMGVANLINIFDPELIILAGEQLQFDHLYSEAVMDAIRASIVQVDKPPPEVVVHTWGSKMWAMGAAASALDHVADLALAGMNADAA